MYKFFNDLLLGLFLLLLKLQTLKENSVTTLKGTFQCHGQLKDREAAQKSVLLQCDQQGEESNAETDTRL